MAQQEEQARLAAHAMATAREAVGVASDNRGGSVGGVRGVRHHAHSGSSSSFAVGITEASGSGSPPPRASSNQKSFALEEKFDATESAVVSDSNAYQHSDIGGGGSVVAAEYATDASGYGRGHGGGGGGSIGSWEVRDTVPGEELGDPGYATSEHWDARDSHAVVSVEYNSAGAGGGGASFQGDGDGDGSFSIRSVHSEGRRPAWGAGSVASRDSWRSVDHESVFAGGGSRPARPHSAARSSGSRRQEGVAFKTAQRVREGLLHGRGGGAAQAAHAGVPALRLGGVGSDSEPWKHDMNRKLARGHNAVLKALRTAAKVCPCVMVVLSAFVV